MHVALAVDEAGQDLAQWSGPNSLAGWQQLQAWANQVGTACQFGIEGAWGNGRRLAQHLLEGGASVYEVNPRWTAEGRRRARRLGKTDIQDARAIALFVRQEAPALPRVFLEDETAVLDLLTSERESAVAEATRLRNQIHALLLQIDPQYRQVLPSLTSVSSLNTLEHHPWNAEGPLQVQRLAAVKRLAQRLRIASSQADDLADQIRSLAQQNFAPLTRLCGVNLLTAGTLAGILGPGRRFQSDAELAAYAGVAPLETSSAGRTRHRLNRGGNRQLNSVIYRIALTQAHHLPAARAYLDRRVSEGKTRREAHRCLRRYVIRAIWRLWQECQSTLACSSSATAA
jgi:transposase